MSNKTFKIMEKGKLQEISNKIAESNFFKKYGYKHYWTSGSSTEVAPITLWLDSLNPNRPACIEIQLGCDSLRGIKRSLDKLVKEIGEKFVKSHYLCKYDGSCPKVAKIYFNSIMEQVALFNKNWLDENTISQMSREEAISTAMQYNGIACIRNKKEVEADKLRHPEKYSAIIIKNL
jgi:hypothetical protein